MRKRVMIVIGAAPIAAALAMACGSSDPAPANAGDGGTTTTTDSGGPGPGPSADGSVDGGDGGATCDGPCDPVDIQVTFGGAVVTLTRAQFGYYSPARDGGPPRVQIEAHVGGSPACPAQGSPTPDQTLILSGIEAVTGPFSTASGATVGILDFKGNLGLPPFLSATNASGNIRALTPGDAGVDAAGSGERLSFDVTAAFDGGTARGRLVAEHCNSLDD